MQMKETLLRTWYLWGTTVFSNMKRFPLSLYILFTIEFSSKPFYWYAVRSHFFPVGEKVEEKHRFVKCVSSCQKLFLDFAWKVCVLQQWVLSCSKIEAPPCSYTNHVCLSLRRHHKLYKNVLLALLTLSAKLSLRKFSVVKHSRSSKLNAETKIAKKKIVWRNKIDSKNSV